jgi:hypothetical protein
MRCKQRTFQFCFYLSGKRSCKKHPKLVKVKLSRNIVSAQLVDNFVTFFLFFPPELEKKKPKTKKNSNRSKQLAFSRTGQQAFS